MKTSSFKELERKVSTLKRRCPWVASLIMHCLESHNPKSFATVRTLLARLKFNSI